MENIVETDIDRATAIIQEQMEELDLKNLMIREGIEISEEDLRKAVFAALVKVFDTNDN